MQERVEDSDVFTTGVIALVRIADETRVVTDGWADRSAREPMRRDHRFQIASVTKTMIAALVMRLVEEQILRLDDPVARWLPGVLPQGRRTTIEHLLSHQSGLFDYTELDPPVESTPYDAMDLVAAAVREPLAFAPGTGSDYSNTNYIVLGLVIEKSTGQPLTKVLERLIFEPAGMEHSTLGMADVPPGSFARGYDGRRDVTITDLAPIASGGVVSTVDDVSRFLQALTDGTLVSQSSLDVMTAEISAPDGLPYGLGGGPTRLPCGTAWGHDGGLPGYSTFAYTMLGEDRAAVVFVNDFQAGTIAESIASAALCS